MLRLSEEYQQEVLKGKALYDQVWIDVLDQAQVEGLTFMEGHVLQQLIHCAIAWSVNWYEPEGKLTDRILMLAIGGH